jgi:methanogenic corrinoid protein MtbC1
MGAVGSSLALSLDNLLQRFPLLLDLAAGRPRKPLEDRSPAALASVIEQEIIPRLLLQHPPLAEEAERSPRPAGAIGEDEVEGFARAAIEADAVALLDRADGLLASGLAPGTLLLEWVAPAARHLGDWWLEDQVSFVDVTMGLWRLQEVTHELAGRMRPRANGHAPAARAMFAVIAGEQHRLGSQILAAFFRAGGWQVATPAEATDEDLLAEVARSPYDLVGLSVSGDEEVEHLPRLIAELRRTSANPDLLVMVGGAVFAGRPELAFLLGADATASDAELALRRADMLVAAKRSQFESRMGAGDH